MKKRNNVIILAALLGSLIVPKAISLVNAKHNNIDDKNNQIMNVIEEDKENIKETLDTSNLSDNAKKVVEAINAINETEIDASYHQHILEVLNAYHSLNNEEKEQIKDAYNVLLNYFDIVTKAKKAEEFDREFEYLLNDSTFEYESKLNELKEQYNSFDEKTKSFVKSYNEENVSAIEENANSLIPDVYYDFTNSTVEEGMIINQGTSVGKDAQLIGSANVENGYLSFGENSLSDRSSLKLPSDLFDGQNDFTFSFEFEKEISDDNMEIIYTIGTGDYHHNLGSEKMGIRAYYASWNKRGPFHQLAHSKATSASGEYGHGPQIVPEGFDLHRYRITVRYLSEAQCIQVYQIDLATENQGYFNFCASGNDFNNNNYIVLDATNFDLSKFNENYLGAKDGNSSGGRSFRGKYYSFRFYNRLVTDREMYGTDDRNLNIGQQEVLNYVNTFEKVGPSFEQYKNVYAPVINKYYKTIISAPYDYQKFFDEEHLEYFMEAYNIVNS